MTRYDGNTGKFVRVPDPVPSLPLPVPSSPLPAVEQPVWEAPESNRPQSPTLPRQEDRGRAATEEGGGSAGIFDGLGKIFSKITKPSFETEDLILVGVFYLLYRESGDIEFLLMAGAILFL